MGKDVKVEIADEAVRIVTGSRRAAYGKPEQNFGRIAHLWDPWLTDKLLLQSQREGYSAEQQETIKDFLEGTLIVSAADVSPMMRLMKEARLLETPDHYDSHVDMVGYALTGAEVSGVELAKPVEWSEGEPEKEPVEWTDITSQWQDFPPSDVSGLSRTVTVTNTIRAGDLVWRIDEPTDPPKRVSAVYDTANGTRLEFEGGSRGTMLARHYARTPPPIESLQQRADRLLREHQAGQQSDALKAAAE